jgi:hypothetical protein
VTDFELGVWRLDLACIRDFTEDARDDRFCRAFDREGFRLGLSNVFVSRDAPRLTGEIEAELIRARLFKRDLVRRGGG